jgi:hypothetical protein
LLIVQAHRAAEKTVVTLASLTEDLVRIAKAAEALADASGLSVARAARTDIAKLNGLIVDRKEIKRVDEFENMTDAELLAWLAERQAVMSEALRQSGRGSPSVRFPSVEGAKGVIRTR